MPADTTAPKHLSTKAREAWRRIVNGYELSPEGETILEVALTNLDIAETARLELARSGIVVDGRRNPAADVLKASHSMYLRAMRQLGVEMGSFSGEGR